jgi:hypothetical protein
MEGITANPVVFSLISLVNHQALEIGAAAPPRKAGAFL